ncbi:hypothetical protein [Stakelama marina]|uniref:Helix-turn-helix domain-containing protein n=1 Tax=Stakelama marina TaxID=2826939 RepID=A0A8T4ICB3_9SPHN|nr:hypothetical protein [Stakelama marina]MBR0551742.1 hypothetical protein [Stakelama marina]
MGQTKRGNKGDASHVRIYDAMQNSEAWQHLGGFAVKALLHIASFEKKSSPNGSLFMSWSALATGIGVSRRTAGAALAELIDKGFLAEMEKGHFHVKGGPATSYRLTWRPVPGAMGPTDDWRKWKPVETNRGCKNDTRAGAKSAPTLETNAATGAESEPAIVETPHVSVRPTGAETTPHTMPLGVAKHGAESAQRKQANSASGVSADGSDPDSIALRRSLASLLERSPVGTQSRIAERANIPGGTLSKFIAGRPLARHHFVALSIELARQQQEAA